MYCHHNLYYAMIGLCPLQAFIGPTPQPDEKLKRDKERERSREERKGLSVTNRTERGSAKEIMTYRNQIIERQIEKEKRERERKNFIFLEVSTEEISLDILQLKIN